MEIWKILIWSKRKITELPQYFSLNEKKSNEQSKLLTEDFYSGLCSMSTINQMEKNSKFELLYSNSGTAWTVK